MRNPLVIFEQPPCAILPNPLGNFNQPYHVPDSRKLIQKTAAPVRRNGQKQKKTVTSHITKFCYLFFALIQLSFYLLSIKNILTL